MNYFIYNEHDALIGKANTRNEAITSGRKWQADWATQGCPNIRHFTVGYNGTKYTQEFDSRNPANLPAVK